MELYEPINTHKKGLYMCRCMLHSHWGSNQQHSYNMPFCVTCHNAFPQDHPFIELREGWHRDANHRWHWITQPSVCFICRIDFNYWGSTHGTTSADFRTSVANRSATEALDKLRQIFGGNVAGQGGFVINGTFVPITKPELNTINLKEKQAAENDRFVRMMRHWNKPTLSRTNRRRWEAHG